MSDAPLYRYGRPMCECMVATLPMIEDRLRVAGLIRQDLSGLIAQGGYSRGKLSAGTHAGGGAIDVAHHLVNTPARVRLWRTCGIAMWERTEKDSPSFGPGNRHGHGIWIGCPHLHPEAAFQVSAYRNGRDGLVRNGPDRYPRPQIVTWREALDTWRTEQDRAQQEEDEMKPTDIAGRDAKGKPFTYAQAAARGQAAYEAQMSGGWFSTRVAKIEAALRKLGAKL